MSLLSQMPHDHLDLTTLVITNVHSGLNSLTIIVFHLCHSCLGYLYPNLLKDTNDVNYVN